MFEMGSTLKRKKLLLEEQILSIKSWPPLRSKAKYSTVVSPKSILIHQNTLF